MANDSSGAVLLGFVMDMFKEQREWRQQHPSDLLTNRSTSAAVDRVQVGETTDHEELLLLMPVWAYQSAAAYLIFISVVGLFMNVVVVIVIISDPQVFVRMLSNSLNY